MTVTEESMIPASEVDAIVNARIGTEVERRVTEAIPGILSKLAAARGGETVAASDHDWANKLALSLAQLTDQGTGRTKRLAPEIIVAREASFDKMQGLIIAARAKGEMPIYSLKHKVYLDERLVEPVWIDPQHVQQKTEIGWPGVPNQVMEPINAVAREIFDAFEGWIGRKAKAPGDELAVTPGGLVVTRRKAPINDGEAEHTGMRRDGRASDYGEGLQVRGRGAAGATRPIAVLGTVAAPAQERVG